MKFFILLLICIQGFIQGYENEVNAKVKRLANTVLQAWADTLTTRHLQTYPIKKQTTFKLQTKNVFCFLKHTKYHSKSPLNRSTHHINYKLMPNYKERLDEISIEKRLSQSKDTLYSKALRRGNYAQKTSCEREEDGGLKCKASRMTSNNALNAWRGRRANNKFLAKKKRLIPFFHNKNNKMTIAGIPGAHSGMLSESRHNILAGNRYKDITERPPGWINPFDFYN